MKDHITHGSTATPAPLPCRGLEIALCLLAGVSALFGGVVLTARPDGSILGIPLLVLEHSPFHDFLIPGLILFLVGGVGNTWAAWLQIRRTSSGMFGALLGGSLLVGWIIVEMILMRSFESLQILYLGLGLGIVAVALLQLRAKLS